jgi:hypothetical protein
MNNNRIRYLRYLEKIREEKINPLIRKINETQARVDFKLHIWWAKKPSNITSLIIKELTRNNEIILDPFVGSGITFHEAIKLKRKCIALDINKLAIFITKTCSRAHNRNNYLDNFNKIVYNLENNIYGKEKFPIPDLYLTRCPKCGKFGQLSYMVYDNEEPIWLRLYCSHEGKIKNIKKKELDRQDYDLLNKIEEINIPFWFPDDTLIENSRINITNQLQINQLFTKRNLITLSIINEEISKVPDSPEKELLKLTFSNILRKSSKLIGTKGGLSIGYWIPKKNRKENNPLLQFKKAKKKILRNWEYMKESGNNLSLGEKFDDFYKDDTINGIIKQYPVQYIDKLLPPNSVDLVLTDPPYGDNVPYLEVSSLWNSWLKLRPDQDDLENEIVLTNSPQRRTKNPKSPEGLTNYENLMDLAFNRISQTLKDKHYAGIWFHELDLPIWNMMIESAQKSGLIYIEQTHILTNIRSLKPKYTPYPTLKGHVISFFVKLSELIPIEDKKEEEDYKNRLIKSENLILETAKEIIKERGGSATTNELYTNEGLGQGGIISKLIKNNLLKIVARRYKNLFSVFKKEFEFDKSDGNWYIK